VTVKPLSAAFFCERQNAITAEAFPLQLSDETSLGAIGAENPARLNWVGDHQPVNALNILGIEQRIYPQCRACSLRQGGFIRQYIKGLK
jgi:hypothetical protein